MTNEQIENVVKVLEFYIKESGTPTAKEIAIYNKVKEMYLIQDICYGLIDKVETKEYFNKPTEDFLVSDPIRFVDKLIKEEKAKEK